MEIGRKFNTLTKKDYFFFIDNYKKYRDFNTLGLYRSILENENLDVADKIEVRNYAHKTFQSTFDFLQLKDPETYFKIAILGENITKGDEEKIWNDIKHNQQKILTDKKIKHRNFGVYSKHTCPYDDCPYKGLMVRQGSSLAYGSLTCRNYSGVQKSERIKKERRMEKQIIRKIIEDE